MAVIYHFHNHFYGNNTSMRPSSPIPSCSSWPQFPPWVSSSTPIGAAPRRPPSSTSSSTSTSSSHAMRPPRHPRPHLHHAGDLQPPPPLRPVTTLFQSKTARNLKKLTVKKCMDLMALSAAFADTAPLKELADQPPANPIGNSNSDDNHMALSLLSGSLY
eukprot:9736334-Heterocapsa_arctica.AAC.1